jgi:hypothetical protein
MRISTQRSGTVDYQSTKMDFADYLKQGGQTARRNLALL